MIETLIGIDKQLFHVINGSWTSGVLDTIMKLSTDKYTWIPLYVIMIFVLMRKFKGYASLGIVLGCLLLSVLIADRTTSGLIKPLVARTRPCIAADMHARPLVACNDTGSFPSSHAANHFAIAIFMIGVMGYRLRSLIAFVWLMWAALIAYSRVYVGVHYPLDVTCGGILGILTGYGCFKLNSQLQKRLYP